MLACLHACVYYAHMRIYIHNYADMILCATCSNRPPVLSDRFCWIGGAVAQDRFYCIYQKKPITVLNHLCWLVH